MEPAKASDVCQTMQDDPDKDSPAESLTDLSEEAISTLAKKMGVSIDEVRRLIAEAAAEAEERKQKPPSPDSSTTK